ncbi:hypothetical protein [Salirhabdus sp. Marseille-P4669]|uniref:hypothetical protein n=1 Tax=Salirhabdus sp. Marseille-P4669 TaxID=2042310 RepID=UPI000C7D19F2|nr:hypothetical protein [Salirhabdus sp. Marseille-P4669]
MKWIRRLLIFVILIGAIGYGVYHFGTKIAAEKIMDYYVEELASSPVMNDVKEKINSNPQIQEFLNEGANIDESVLPFTTKEEAAKELVSKFGASEIVDIVTDVSDGVSEQEQLELLQKVEGKLSEEELLALQVIAYKELNNQ